MAGDWIKFEKSTGRKTEMLRLAVKLDIPVDQAVGLCIRFWCWVDDELDDGFLRGVKPEMLDLVMNYPRFTEAMVAVGWLNQDSSGTLSVPNFIRHFSQSAKTRATSAKRQQKYRDSKTRGRNGRK